MREGSLLGLGPEFAVQTGEGGDRRKTKRRQAVFSIPDGRAGTKIELVTAPPEEKRDRGVWAKLDLFAWGVSAWSWIQTYLGRAKDFIVTLIDIEGWTLPQGETENGFGASLFAFVRGLWNRLVP